jgi:hypothetical protein
MDSSEKRLNPAREPYNITLDFTILLIKEAEFMRVAARGETVDKSPAGIGIITDFPLEAGHVLRWNDQDNKKILYLALVKWSLQIDNRFRAGLLLI